ncbi:MAG: hypothetical protein LUC93_07405 [Planctomycetaceae bacterium]|nr:hypothetical protein [Planctomycetaceae bacterium]
MKVREIAHSRTGDKGDFSLVSVFAYDEKGYEKLKRDLTIGVVKEAYSEICLGAVKRYELPKLRGFIYELEHALGGGVTRSLALDGHGKNLCYVMLDIDIPD